ncbi:MAG: hypothetical protein OXF89_19195 [Rhodospirillaceae bacterium]|nr:hypothetical protein [Rhodospirillaceae bacterium]
MNSRLTLAGICLLAAFGLAACGGGGGSGGGGVGGTATAPPATTTPTPPSALQTAAELDGRLADVDVDALQMSAIENAGKLNAEAVKGDSAMATANAQAILDADAAIRQAVMDADAVIEQATAAKEAAEDIEDAAERAAVMRLLDDAIEKANTLKTKAEAHIAEAASDDATVNTLGEAVAAVTNPTGADPAVDPAKTAADAGEAVAATVLTALAQATVADGSASIDADAIRDHDYDDIGALNWEEIMGTMNIAVMDVRRFASGAISEVKAASVDGRKVSDFVSSTGTAPTEGDHADGTDFDSTRRGIEGTVFCGGADCKVDADGVMTGSWYFTPDSTTELYVAGEDDAYVIATLYARYGYWLTYTDGNASGVSTFAVIGHSTTNTANLNLVRGADATADVTASYSGDALGIAVRNKASGEFTADVSLTATFGETAGKLGGHISKFAGGVADPNWRVMLQETDLNASASFDNPGVASGTPAAGGTAAGQWTAQGYGPTPAPGPDGQPGGGDDVNQRPTGFFGRFNAYFGDGSSAVAGAYATRAD